MDPGPRGRAIRGDLTMTHKLKFKPTSPKRLSTHRLPIPMRGDPPWDGTAENTWEAKSKAVYEAMMRAKQLELPLEATKSGVSRAGKN